MYRKYFVAICLSLVLGTVVLSLNTAYAEPPTTPPDPFDRQNLSPLSTLASYYRQGPQLTPNTPILTWSKMVFQSYRDDNWEVYISNDDGSGLARLTNHNRSDIHPHLNRGATHIVFASNRGSEVDFEIYKMNANGGNLIQLTDNSGDDGNPVWSPDGNKIAFESYRNGQGEIYVMNADGSGQTRLTHGGGFNGMPTWSPDGSKIAFVSYRTGGYRIWVMNVNGSGQTQLSNQAYSFHPTWSPDGSQIAYDVAGGDGWQNIWLMNANGTNQHLVYNPQGSFDAWPRSWSPNGRYIAFSQVRFIQHQGQWYWHSAYTKAHDILGNIISLNNSLYDWYPQWQTKDNQPPTTNLVSLPNPSPGPFTVQWSGSDTGGAGLSNYDVQIKVGSNNWTDWQIATTNTSAQYPGIGGETYTFRVRARDNAYNTRNWSVVPAIATTVENLPPVTAITPLSPFRRADNPLITTWYGYDPGNSGIANYDVRYKINNGNWVNWQNDTTDTSASITSGIAGQTFTFQSRATDKAQNNAGWPVGNRNASTTLYAWRLTGHLHDNTGTPIRNALVDISTTTFSNLPSNNVGEYATYTQNSQNTYIATWNKQGYGSLPPTQFSFARDGYLNGIIPPIDNVIQNGDFESGSLSPAWIAQGTYTPTITDTLSHTGENSLLFSQGLPDFAPEQKISADTQNFLYAIMADQTGNLHFIWLDSTGAVHKWRSDDGTWHSGATLNLGSTLVWDMEADIDHNGIIHLIWQSIENDIYYAQLDTTVNNSPWSNPINISNDSNWSRNPDLAVNGQGEIHVGWETGVPGSASTNIAHSYRLHNGTWGTIEIFNPSDYDRSPNLLVTEDGTLHMMWLTSDVFNAKQIIYMQRSPNGTWSNMKSVAPNQTDLWLPQMIVDQKGVVHIAWSNNSTNNNGGIYYSSRLSNGVWTNPQRISSGDWGHLSPLVLDSSGGLHVAWSLYDGNVYYAHKNKYGTWYEPQFAGQNNVTDGATSTIIAVGKDSRAHIVSGGNRYSSSDDRYLYYLRQLADGAWAEAQNIENVNDNMQPYIIIDDTNSVHIAWTKQTDLGGDVYYISSRFAQDFSNSQVTQHLTVPITITTPVLSFMYQLEGIMSSSNLSIQVDNGSSVTPLLEISTNTSGWAHEWIDLTTWRGQPISLTFNLVQAANTPLATAYIDGVTVGSTYPDLWVAGTDKNALAGETIIQEILYGNRGGATAVTNLITYTLSTGLSFVSADIPPSTTTANQLVWQIDELPAKGEPLMIEVTLVVEETAPPFTTLTNTIEIGTEITELEMLNNYAEGGVYIGRFIYLPVIYNN